MAKYYVISEETMTAIFDYLLDRPHREWVSQCPLSALVNRLQGEIGSQNKEKENEE